MRDHVLERDVSFVECFRACARNASLAACSFGESAVLRRSFGSLGMSSTDCRWPHFRTAFSLIPYLLASLATEACDRCSSLRMASVVLALPPRVWLRKPLCCDDDSFTPSHAGTKCLGGYTHRREFDRHDRQDFSTAGTSLWITLDWRSLVLAS
jgi:hypothetical protein